MNESYKRLKPYMEKAQALQTAMVLFEWDNETLAPRAAAPYTARMIGAISEEYLRVMTDETAGKLARDCGDGAGMTEAETAALREFREEMKKLERIPAKEYREYAELTARSAGIWAEARKNRDFGAFAPTLRQVLDYQKRFASYQAEPGQKLYDVMLDSYEKGFDMESLDRFFRQLKTELVPFLRQVMDCGRQPDDAFLEGDYPKEKQEAFAGFLARYVGFDFDRGVMAVSAHPFTTNLHNHDVRITNAYTRRVDDAIFSVIHESGHGIYEQGIPDALTLTPAGQGASMGMHESQSRFFENIIGRSRAFWVPLYGRLQETFPEQLKTVSLDAFVRAVNKARPGLIRIQADELTYSLHIMVRYEVEKLLVEQGMDVRELPEIWAEKYREYLGVCPENDGEGVLQDIHWSQGSFGYFPSYALGSAFGAQMYETMKTQMDVEGLLEQGNPAPIREYLREHVHRYGKMKPSRQILKDMTGKEFDAGCYIRYLKEKYRMLYGI